MTRFFRTLPIDCLTRFWPYFLVVLTTLPALARWFHAELPAGADTAIHLFRAVELDWAVRHGYLYPRWAPDMVFGFGYPLFNMHGPTAQYLIAGIHALGLNFIAATLSTFALADGLGALGAYTLARAALGNWRAGLMAAVAYAYAPYVLGSLYRGSPAEALALGLLPWLLWAFYRLTHAPSLARIALAAVLFALFPLLHNPSTVLASGTLLVFLVGLVWANRQHSSFVIRHLSFALALGFALSAFYWLPVLLETRYIQIARAYAPNVLNFHFNFLSLRELLALPQTFDPKMIGWSAPRSYGLPQVALAALGLARWRRRAAEQNILLGLAAAGVLALGFLTLPQAVWVWEHLPGLSLIQFPARLLGPGSLLLALLVGAAFANDGRRVTDDQRWPFALRLSSAVALVVVFNLPWTLQHLDPLVPANATITDIQDFERRSGSIGTTTAGEYLPIWVKDVPPPDTLRAAYAADPVINRLDLTSLPEGAQVTSQTPSLISQKVALTAPTAFTATFNVFYFPGWRAQVDGVDIPITPSAPYGLITVPVPAGTHTVTIAFGTTPPRVAGGLIALAGFVVWAGLLVNGWNGRRNRWNGEEQKIPLHPAPHLFYPLTIAGIAIVLTVFKIAIVDARPTIFSRTRFDGETLAGVQHPLAIDFADQLQLLGYETNAERVPSGGALEVTLYWRALQPLARDYSTTLAVVDADGHRFAQSDSQHPAGFPTSRWPVEDYGRDAHTLALLPGTPPGTYHLLANVYRPDTLIPLSVGVPIGEITVTRPAQPAELRPEKTLNARFGPIELEGADMGVAEIGVGADLPLTLYWKTITTPEHDLTARLTLSNGEARYVGDFPPARADYVTSQWQAGETLRAPLAFHIPAEAPSGDYTLSLTMGQASAVIGAVRVVAPERTFTTPVLPHVASAKFGEVAELIGWMTEGKQLTLYWRALSTPRISYTVFVHVHDESGTIVSQRDTTPAQGTRPTPSWLPGEIIADAYALEVPATPFSLWVGVYDQSTGARLTLENGDNQLELK